MPMYEYKCDNCMVVHDVLVPLKMFDILVKCPDCDGSLKRLVSSPSFVVH